MKKLQQKVNNIRSIPEHMEVKNMLSTANLAKKQNREKRQREMDANNMVIYNRLTNMQPTYKVNEWTS